MTNLMCVSVSIFSIRFPERANDFRRETGRVLMIVRVEKCQFERKILNNKVESKPKNSFVIYNEIESIAENER